MATREADGGIKLAIEINEEHNISMRETEDNFKAEKTVKDHNRRLQEMIIWVKDGYPEYYGQGIVELSEDQKADKKRYCTPTHDFMYRNLNPMVIKAFLSKKKFKPNKFTMDGKPIYSFFSYTRKF